MKTCTKCGVDKSDHEFSKWSRSKDGLLCWCRVCKAKQDRRWYEANIDKSKGYHARRGKEWRLENRFEVLRHYGGCPPLCACCGEFRVGFLSIDHVNGGGRRHRKQIKTGSFYVWLRKTGYPTGYQVLCHNCNMSKGLYGVCPHEKERQCSRKS